MSVSPTAEAGDGTAAGEGTAAPAPRAGAARLALAGAVVLALAALYISGALRVLSVAGLRGHLDGLRSRVHDRPVAAFGAFVLVYAGSTALSLPAAAGLSLAAGVLFGRALGTAAASLGSTLGATLAMLAGRYVLRDFVRARLGGRLAPIDRGVERDGLWYLLSLRLAPVFPYTLVNLAMALTRMRVIPYALTSMVGMLPMTFLLVNAGAELGRVDRPGRVLSPRVLVALVLIGLLPLAARLALRPRQARKDSTGGSPA